MACGSRKYCQLSLFVHLISLSLPGKVFYPSPYKEVANYCTRQGFRLSRECQLIHEKYGNCQVGSHNRIPGIATQLTTPNLEDNCDIVAGALRLPAFESNAELFEKRKVIASCTLEYRPTCMMSFYSLCVLFKHRARDLHWCRV
jgi:hypothetical protein